MYSVVVYQRQADIAEQQDVIGADMGQFNSGIEIDGQFQFQFRNWNWNWNCLFEKIIELELNWN